METKYTDMIRSSSTKAEHLVLLANSLHDLGDYRNAIAAYHKAILIAPDFAPAYNNLAVTLNLCGYHQEALLATDLAIQQHPASAEALANRGIALKGLGRLHDAELSYKQSLALCPDQAATFSCLGSLLSAKGDYEGAVTAFRHALKLKPDLDECRLKLTMLMPPQSGITASYLAGKIFDNALNELELGLPAARLADFGAIVGTAQPFALAYANDNHTERLARYGRLVCKSRSAWFRRQYAQPSLRMPPRTKPRLVIVSGQISNHSVWNVLLHGFLQQLDHSRFEIILYNTTPSKTAEAKTAQSLVDVYVFGSRDWIKQALHDQPDLIYYPEIAMDPVTAQLATLRLAPLQLAGWGHPITTGLPTIDLFLSGELIEPPEADHHYCEQLVRLPGTGACSILPQVIAFPPNLQQLDLPADRTVVRFLICQQAAKLDPLYDMLYPRIAMLFPTCKFWFVRDRHSSWQSVRLEQRLYEAFTDRGLNPAAYIKIIEWMPAEQFLGLLDVMDIYLDTPAFSGYTTAWQALHRGISIVTLEGQFMRQRLASGLLRRIGLSGCIAVDENDYIVKASALAANSELRVKLRTLLPDVMTRSDNDIRVVRAFEAVVCDSLQESGRL